MNLRPLLALLDESSCAPEDLPEDLQPLVEEAVRCGLVFLDCRGMLESAAGTPSA